MMKTNPTAHDTPMKERLLFLKHCFISPLRMGAFAPSSMALGHALSRHVVCQPGDVVLELGAGTGRLTRALLSGGIPIDQMVVVELEKELCGFLRKKFPDLDVRQGDASYLETLLDPSMVGRVSTVISAIPMIYVPYNVRRAIIDSAFKVLAPGGMFLQVTYGRASPLPSAKFGLQQKCLGRVFLNMPPASIWGYTRPE